MNAAPYIDLLKTLISLPSYSREEARTAAAIARFMELNGLKPEITGYNVVVRNDHFKQELPTLLLVSHHDTVRPGTGYTRDPFRPDVEDGRLYGLGSNDAGASLVALLAAFDHFRGRTDLPFNIIFAAVAEEEVSGSGGLEKILPSLGPLALAIVGEPTEMQPAVAERGLLVLDCTARGMAGHAAHKTGENAIYIALDDIAWLRSHRFSRVSKFLGEVGATVTVIHAGDRHNVIPDTCSFTVDVRLNECYTHQEVLDEIRSTFRSEVVPRSMRLKASALPAEHRLHGLLTAMGLKPFGSSTLSDMALLSCPAVKMGPGSTYRSHTADEYVLITELEQGMEIYTDLIERMIAHGI